MADLAKLVDELSRSDRPRGGGAFEAAGRKVGRFRRRSGRRRGRRPAAAPPPPPRSRNRPNST